MTDYPSVSVIIPTFNSERTLEKCLNSITSQDYPAGKTRIIVVDGGSCDSTLEVAKRFDAEIVMSKTDQENPERRKALGVLRAKNEIVVLIDSDNILPHKKWFLKMIEPFSQNMQIIATQPLRYAYNKNFSLLNRYFALFGVNDPVAYYLNKRDRLSWAEESWNLLGKAEDKGNYFLVKFSPKNVPTLGANGFLIRREILLRARCNPSEFFHIDVNYDLIKLGYNKYGIVKEDIIHLTGNTFYSFIRKRLRYMKKYYLENQSLRRYRIYTSSDKWKLIKYIIYSLTLIKPLYDSYQGYRKIKDSAWFLHPLMCLSVLFVYGFTIIRKGVK